MRNLIVVENPKSWPLDVPGAEVVAAREYLVDNRFSGLRRARVCNLCRSYRYHSLGYYVSLLAEARGHRVMPAVTTFQDLREDAMVRIAGEEMEDLLARSLAQEQGVKRSFDVYFGVTQERELQRLARALFNRFPAPFLRAQLVKDDGWRLDDVNLLPAGDIPDSQQAFAVEQARRFFARPRSPATAKEYRYDLAILVNPKEVDAPSDEGALQRFQKAAQKLGMETTLIERDDIGRLAEYDALFIRETTYVNHHTFRFARRAAAEGMFVIDDPVSIARCTNKVFLAEAFGRAGVPSPKTMIVHRDNAATVGEKLGFPCVLKRPDSSFSLGVSKAKDEAELQSQLRTLLDESELVVAQAWTPSDFDWRVGMLGGKPLWVCKYYMARGHWQIQKDLGGGKRRYGKVESVAVEDAPRGLLEVARKAAAVIGTGLYGVDVKPAGDRFVVMEVNDNPNIDAGNEDAVLKDELYLRVMQHFLDALEARGAASQAGNGTPAVQPTSKASPA